MRIKVVLSRPTLDLLWALGAADPPSNPREALVGPGDAVVELDELLVSDAIDLFEEDTFDEAIRRLAHAKLAEREGDPHGAGD